MDDILNGRRQESQEIGFTPDLIHGRLLAMTDEVPVSPTRKQDTAVILLHFLDFETINPSTASVPTKPKNPTFQRRVCISDDIYADPRVFKLEILN